MAIQWRDQFSVGNDLVDTDHKYLLEIINRAEVSLQGHQHAALVALLDELAHYGAKHFKLEELVAGAVDYPKADQLHVSHQALVESLAKFRAELGDSWTEQVGVQFATFLRDWLLNHVIKEDLLLKPWMTKFSPRFDPRT